MSKTTLPDPHIALHISARALHEDMMSVVHPGDEEVSFEYVVRIGHTWAAHHLRELGGQEIDRCLEQGAAYMVGYTDALHGLLGDKRRGGGREVDGTSLRPGDIVCVPGDDAQPFLVIEGEHEGCAAYLHSGHRFTFDVDSKYVLIHGGPDDE